MRGVRSGGGDPVIEATLTSSRSQAPACMCVCECVCVGEGVFLDAPVPGTGASPGSADPPGCPLITRACLAAWVFWGHSGEVVEEKVTLKSPLCASPSGSSRVRAPRKDTLGGRVAV